MKCRSCGGTLDPRLLFCDLGVQPLANALLRREQLENPETHYPTQAHPCPRCLLVQLPTVPSPIELFPEDYLFRSASSVAWHRHCRQYADRVIEQLDLNGESRVVEIGSNDGTMLRRFRDRGIPALGVEPSQQLAEYAQVEGLATVCAFWSEAFARGMAEHHKPTPGYADLVIANNVLAHVPDLLDFLRGVKAILAQGGVATFEVPHIAHLIEDAAFDQVYAEHHCYFSLHSLAHALGQVGLDVQDVEEIPTHGGSLRVWVRLREEDWETSERAQLVYQDECDRGLDKVETYLQFASRPPEIKRAALDLLIQQYGKKVVGYGASAKATTMLNYLGVGSEWISAVGDVTPAKRGRFLPGVRIPVVGEDALQRLQPDVVVNFLWNWREESEARLRDLLPGVPILYLNQASDMASLPISQEAA